MVEDLFKQYARYAGSNFAWKSVDPDRDPALARTMGVEAYGTTVLEAKGRTEKVQDADQEEKLTNALVKVMREGKRSVYVVQGHGEPDLANSEQRGFSEAKTALEKANYDVKPLALARQGTVPDDAAVVIVAGPRTDFLAPEIRGPRRLPGQGRQAAGDGEPAVPRAEPAGVAAQAAGRLGARRSTTTS